MRFAIRPFTEADADSVASWRYPAPYDAYDVSEDPSLDQEMREPARWGASWFAVGGSDPEELVGFLELIVAEPGSEGDVEVEVGLGLRPDLTGRGLGVELVETALRFSRERWGPKSFALDVFPWNERAIRCYERAGFERGQVYVRRFDDGNEVTFLRMSRRA